MADILGVAHVDVFGVQVGVFRSWKKFQRHMKRLGVEVDDFGASHGMARADMGEDGAPWFSIIIPKGARLSTLAHESVHMADFIMDALGIPVGVDNTEVRAYLTGHIFGSVQEMIA